MAHGIWLGEKGSSPNGEKATQGSQGLELVGRQWESGKWSYSGHVLEEELIVLTDGWRCDQTVKKRGVRAAMGGMQVDTPTR